MHDTLPPEPTHEPIYSTTVTITFNLSLDATPQAASQVEELVKSYMQGQLNEDIQDGFTNWCASIECAEDKDLDFALDHDQLKLDILVPPAKSHAQLAREAAKREQRKARNEMIRRLLDEHRTAQAQATTPSNITLLPTPRKPINRSQYATPDERKEAQRARRRELRAAKRNNPSA